MLQPNQESSTELEARFPPLVLMGVSGSGKSTLGSKLASELNWEFVDADELHPKENIQLMSAGQPLTDDQRHPWLELVGERLVELERADTGVVLACSALKRSYRDTLRSYVPDAAFAFMSGPPEILQQRVDGRKHPFMSPSLLDSQFESLEPLGEDEEGIVIDVRDTPQHIVEKLYAYTLSRGKGES